MSTTLAGLRAALTALEAQVREVGVLAEEAFSEAASAASISASPAGSASTPVTLEWLNSVVAASTREALSALVWAPIADLVRSSRIPASGGWTAELRLARAYRAGYLASCALAIGRTEVPASIEFQLSSSLKYHVVLTCPAYPAGFWSDRSRPFCELVGNPTGRGPYPNPPTSVFCSFYTKCEVSAYLRGAGRGEWPQYL